MKTATLRKFRATLAFEIEGISRGEQISDNAEEELRDFIKDALECWGGQRHPDDWLFGSLENVTVTIR